MVTTYDSYDYPRYWRGREYENQAEKKALKNLFKSVPTSGSLIDIGGGYGRLLPDYLKKFRTVTVVDPSNKLLNLARKEHNDQNEIIFKRGRAEKIPVNSRMFEIATMVRVSHHLTDLEKALIEIKRVLKPGGFLILEFANKAHLKSLIQRAFRRDWGYLLSHLPENLSGPTKIPFYNYHPSHIKSLLLSNGFKIHRAVSVSNFRNPIFKKWIPLKILLWMEFHLSLLTSFFPFHFGPSVFILAQKDS